MAALALAFLAVPLNLLAVLSGASDIPLVSLFISWITRETVPAGWLLVSPPGLGPVYEVYAVASVGLALMIGFPAISCFVFSRIVSADVMRRKEAVGGLAALASVAFLAGVLSGLHAFDFVAGLKVVPLSIPSTVLTVLDIQTFSPSVIGFVLLCGTLFAAPVFLGAAWKFRGRAEWRQRASF